MSRTSNRKTISYYSDVFDFGKYKGLSVDQVMEQDPGYLIWAQENCQSVELRQDILDEAAQLADQIKRFKEDIKESSEFDPGNFWNERYD